MAARNPSAITQYVDEESFLSGLPIIADEPDNVHDDMVFILDAPQLIISDAFWPIRTLETADEGANSIITTYILKACDMCGDDSNPATVTIKNSARVWVDATETGNIAFDWASDVATTTFTNNTPAWLDWQTCSFDQNDSEEKLQLSVWCSTGNGTSEYAYIDAVAIWVDIR